MTPAQLYARHPYTWRVRKARVPFVRLSTEKPPAARLRPATDGSVGWPLTHFERLSVQSYGRLGRWR